MFLTTSKFKFVDVKNYNGPAKVMMLGGSQWVVDWKS